MAELVLSRAKLQKFVGFTPHLNQTKILEGLERYTFITAGRRFGKTILAGYIALEALCLKDKVIWVVAPTYDLGRRTWRYIHEWALRKFGGVIELNESRLTMLNTMTGSRLEIKSADSPASCVGEGVNLMIADEANLIADVVWYEALFATLSDKNGRLIAISSPYKKGGWFYEGYQKGLLKLDVDYTGFTFETKDNLSIPELVREQQLAKTRLPERAYIMHYEAKFLDDDGQVFRNIRACVSGELEEPQREKTYCIGVDLARVQDYTVITVLDLVNFHVVHFERFNEISWEAQVKRIQDVATKYNNAPIVCDSTGVGDPVAERLERAGFAVTKYQYTNSSKKYLIDNLALKLDSKEISFPKIDDLITELEVFGFEVLPSGQYRYNAPNGCHDDCVNSLALAVYGAGHFQHDLLQIKDPYPVGSLGYEDELYEMQDVNEKNRYLI